MSSDWWISWEPTEELLTEEGKDFFPKNKNSLCVQNLLYDTFHNWYILFCFNQCYKQRVLLLFLL